MGKFIKTHFCPGCGGSLSTQRRNGGHNCRTDGCDIQKCWFNEQGELIRVVRSTTSIKGLGPVTQRLSDVLLFEQGILVVEP